MSNPRPSANATTKITTLTQTWSQMLWIRIIRYQILEHQTWKTWTSAKRMIPTWTRKTRIGMANPTFLVVVLIHQAQTLSQMMMAMHPSEPALESVLQLYFV